MANVDGRFANSSWARSTPVSMIVTGGQDNVQAVVGQMLMFFSELGCQFPQFPFIAHTRGWSAEDMENNEQYVRDSKFLHDGAAALVRRSADMARVMIESALGRDALVRGGRKGSSLELQGRHP